MLLPVYFKANILNEIRISKNYFLSAAIVISLILFGFKSRPGYQRVALAILAAWTVLICKSFYTAAALQQISGFILALAFIQQASMKLKHRDDKNLSEWFVIVCFMQCLFVGLNLFGINLWNLTVKMKYVSGSLGQPTHAGALIAITLPFLFTTGRFKYLALPIAGLALYHCQSAMAVLSALNAVVFYLLLNKNTRIASLGVLVILNASLVMLFYGYGNIHPFFDDNSRIAAWHVALKTIFSWNYFDILFGRGLGNLWNDFSLYYKMQRFTYVHNEYIESLWAFGILGTSLIMGLAIRPFLIKTTQNKEKVFLASYVAFLTNCFGNFPMHLSTIALVGCLTYAYLIRVNNSNELTFGGK